MNVHVARATAEVLARNGLRVGTSLENHVTWLLHCAKALDQMQYHVGRYRLDYAWPRLLVALEADGPRHQTPMGAAADVRRDMWLREQGWLVFRVGYAPNLDEQVARVLRVVQLMSEQREPEGEALEPNIHWRQLVAKDRELRERENALRELRVGPFGEETA
jgi:very-short-patch-repair endonuclease